MKRAIPPLLLAALLGACAPKPNPDEKAIFAAIEENTRAMEKEDIAAVMDTVHPDTPSFDGTKAFLEDFFTKTDLRYEVRDLKLIGFKDGEAKVSFVQRSIPLKGDGASVEVLAEGVHTLRKDGEKWKIVSTVAAPK